MTARWNDKVATGALTLCVICHAWGLITLVREVMNHRTILGVATPVVVVYMAAAAVFNWCAVASSSIVYHRCALTLTIVHLAGALVQGAAAEAILNAGGQGAEWIVTFGVTLPALLNLPMDSTQVIGQLSNPTPWFTAAFFALNLAMVGMRVRQLSPHPLSE